MTLQRFFLPAEAFDGDVVRFPAPVAHQIRRVLRAGAGDRVIALDNSGREFLIRLGNVGDSVTGTVVERRPNRAELVRPLVLYQGLVKGPKFETIVQHCTEVGVARIVPTVTRRAVPAEPSPARQRRFESIAREAAEQSGRGRVPIVEAPMTLTAAVMASTSDGQAIMPYEQSHGAPLADVVDRAHGGAISLLIGPEGGFDDAEVALAQEAGVAIVSLGPRILRAETAAIVACGLVAAAIDR